MTVSTRRLPCIQRRVFILPLLLLMLLAAWPAGLTAQEDSETREAIKTLRLASKARAAIVRRVSPAVVGIHVETVSKEGNSVPRFFSPRPPNSREFPQRGVGSGSIVDKRGYILTNNHVIENADRITVRLKDGKEYPAKLVGADPKTDLAVVKIEAKGLPVAKLGDSDALEVGETVIAIGSALGLEHTVTQGIVSAKQRTQVGRIEYKDFIQTDASINVGNSGGPLINLNGEVVGVNTLISSFSGGSIGIGFSIPINMARQIMQSLIDTGKVTRGFLGVGIQDLTAELAESLGVRNKEGVLITSVGPDTPAGRAGIKQEDIITQFNGKRVVNTNALRNVVAAVRPGAKVKVNLIRKGKAMRLTVTISEQPSDMLAAIQGEAQPPGEKGPAAGGGKLEKAMGLQVESLNPAIADELGYRNMSGVVVSQVEPTSQAAEKGLRRGTLIEQVNRRVVNNVQEFRAELAKIKQGESVLMFVRFRQSARFIVLKKP